MVSAGGPAEMRQRSEFGAGELACICWTGQQEGTSQEEGPTSLVQTAHVLVLHCPAHCVMLVRQRFMQG